jgi:hypothetical protein
MKASIDVTAKAAPSSKLVDPPGSYYGNTSSTVELPIALPTLLNETAPLPQLYGQCSNNVYPPPPLPSQNETPLIFEEPKKPYYLLSHAE